MRDKSIDPVAVVVLNYKAVDDTINCIKSLKSQTYPNIHLIVVENGSHDESSEKLKSSIKSKNITVLYNEKNLGFAGGVNTGIKWAKKNNFEYVALFNNDASADKDWVNSLMETMKSNSTYGGVTGLLLKKNGRTIDSTAEQYSTWGLAFPTNRGRDKKYAPKEVTEIFGATGGATLYRMRLFDEIGYFDESLFAYYEDIDLSFRAQLRGWKIAYTPKAIAYHSIGGTSSKIPGFTTQQTFRNLPLLFIKNVPGELLFGIGIRFFLAYTLMLLKAALSPNIIPALKGFIKGIGLFWGKGIHERKLIQSSKKVSDEYIQHILWPDLPPDQTGIRKLRKFFTGK